jgi:hypothetical protein
LALILIYQGLKHGLLEAPGMSVKGNGSYDHYLKWFVDRSSETWPKAWVLSIPDKVYHYIMLAWAMWLAMSIIRWLRWGWKSFSSVALWKKSPKKIKPNKTVDNQTNKEITTNLT